MRHSPDVIVIGGGVIGCATAFYLAKLGISVTVFEQRSFGWGASGATAGVVAPLWHVPHEHERYFSLALKSLEMYPGLAQELLESGVNPEFRQSGVLKVATTGEQVEELQRGLAWQGELGMGVEWLGPREVMEREPEINPSVLGGVFSPQEGFVHGQRLVDALVQAGSRLGASFVDKTEVVGLEASGSRVEGVRTRAGTVSSGHVVLAAGPWTGNADRWASSNIPVRPVKGQRILLKLPGLLPRCPVHAFGGYCVPQADGSILVAATRHEGELDHDITADAVVQMIGVAANLYPGLRTASFVGARAGVRPGSPDELPIIGPVPGRQGLIVASGHDAVGVMLAPATGDAVAQYIATGDETPLEPFSLARFA